MLGVLGSCTGPDTAGINKFFRFDEACIGYEISLESCPGQVEADTICGCSQAASITCQAKGIKNFVY